MRIRRTCLLACLTATAVLAQAEPAKAPRPVDLDALLAAFARMPGLEASYTEAKHLSLLAVPLQSRGKLYFLPPGYMTRVVEAPEKSTLTVTPQQLRVESRDGVETVDLRSSDRVRRFVTSLVAVFRGDRKALEADYTLDYAAPGDVATWTLTLTPRGKPLQQMLQKLVLRGEGTAVTGIEVVEPNGDRTVTTIVRADAQRQFTAAEKQQLFGLRDAAGGEKAK